MDRDERLRAATDNLVGAFDLVRRHFGDARGGHRSFGSVEVAAVGHDLAFYNPVLALDREAAVDDVLAALDWVESRGLAASVNVSEKRSGENAHVPAPRRANACAMRFRSVGLRAATAARIASRVSVYVESSGAI
jgi:hypothetical protein